jgi:hypothetical protein
MLRILFCIFFFITQTTNASISGLSGHYSKSIVFSQINAAENFPLPNKETTCQSQILNMSQDNELTIFVALGYIDFSAGQDFNSSTSLYGVGDVLDLDAYDAFTKALTRQCSAAGLGKKSKMFACGFSRSSGGFSKTITNRFTGKNMRVYIKVASSAYSSNDKQNKTTYAAKQTAKSKNTQSQFLSALKSYDAVIYMGHARSGGGPDFFPPKLLANGHVDYGYYKKNRPGISTMLGALQGSSDSDMIGVLACKSTNLFASSIRKYAPNSGLVTADKLFAFDDLIPTGFTLVEGIVGQRCNENFSNVVQNHLPGDFLSMYF